MTGVVDATTGGDGAATAGRWTARAIGTGEELDAGELLAAPLRSLPSARALSAPLRTIRGCGSRLAAAAEELGICTVGDLLAHVPHGYRDRSRVRQIGDLRIGERATVLAEVRSARVRPTRRRNLRMVEAAVADATGPMTAVWFNQAWLAERLRPGTRLLINGRLERNRFVVAAHELISGSAGGGIHTTGLAPVHPASERLRAARIREWAWSVRGHAWAVSEPLPARTRVARGMPGAADATAAVHFPGDEEQAGRARRRLAFEELLCHQAALWTRRSHRDRERDGIPLPPPGSRGEASRWLELLPFEPTAGQRGAFAEIDADLGRDRPMQRLLMGEVGSGKTVVALYAMLRAAEAGYQAALMAPTETLAEQHAATLAELLAGRGSSFALLTSATSGPRRREALERLAAGDLQMAVGTHALIEAEVEFAGLAVCVVDEQHRFGVRQRALLDAKGAGGAAPHVLHMTATPIPRTLSLTAYGDLDTTVLRELPVGRGPVTTTLVPEDGRAAAYEFVRERLREGRQAFVVCPLVEGSEKLEARAASEEAERLRSGELRDFEVELLHGQMPARAKGEAMERFASGAARVLVATSVIEVGIDVPNATVMVVEGADRYGISQLHQLRGRVGRGPHESHCLLFADRPSPLATRRLRAVAAERDGFRLAETDLALRGEGEILGTRQHGLPRFRAASLPEDAELLIAARREIEDLLCDHGSLDAPELVPLLDAARARFGERSAAGIPA